MSIRAIARRYNEVMTKLNEPYTTSDGKLVPCHYCGKEHIRSGGQSFQQQYSLCPECKKKNERYFASAVGYGRKQKMAQWEKDYK